MTPDSRHPARRRIAPVLALAAIVGLAFLGVVGWHYADLILGPDRPPTLHEQRILAVDPSRVRLSRDAESLQPGVWALQWPDGFGRVGRVLESDSATVLREFEPIAGLPVPGGWASLRGVSRTANPLAMLGLSYQSVSYAGPLGRYPAWFVPGPDSTWVVYVHGRGTNRSEGLRTLGVLAARGLPGLLVTYRNDPGAPASSDGRYRLGLTEWEDLEAAIRFALTHGARGLVLAGYSMGGQIVMQFLSRSALAGQVRGVVLESPVLDWNAMLAFRSRQMGVPIAVLRLGQSIATWRAGIDWGQLDRVAHHERVQAPILLFHDAADAVSPVSVSETFARALPACVTLVRVRGGNHVEAWNVDPERYAVTVNRWCDEHSIGRVTP